MTTTQEPSQPALKGSCLCGQIKLTCKTAPICITNCHCNTCRKLSGHPYLAFGLWYNTDLTWTDTGEPATSNVRISASEIAVRGFCASCNTPLYMKYHFQKDHTSVPMGVIDNNSSLQFLEPAKENIFLREKAFWIDLSQDKADMYDGFEDAFQAEIDEWVKAGKSVRKDVPSTSDMPKISCTY